jgi:hypothetical protein
VGEGSLRECSLEEDEEDAEYGGPTVDDTAREADNKAPENGSLTAPPSLPKVSCKFSL